MKQLAYYILTLLLLSACRQDVMIVPMEKSDPGGKTQQGDIIGMYLLNEGNMGSNKSSLDYLDLSDSTAHYYRWAMWVTTVRYMARVCGWLSTAQTRLRWPVPIRLSE